MSIARYLVGDSLDRLADLDDDSVDLVMTSPPFLALRDYGVDGQIGQEANPAAFLAVMLKHTEAWTRVLAPHGSICVELGDTYSGSGGAGGDYNDDGLREGQPRFRQDRGNGWPPAKSLCLIPQLYAASLAYGRNLLDPAGTLSPIGDGMFEPWLVRNVVAWCRPNPPVGALGDKFRPAVSYLTVATRSPRRWFDLDAARTPHQRPRVKSSESAHQSKVSGAEPERRPRSNEGNEVGAPPLDYWEIPTHPYRGAHYATYPPELCRIPILSMCPQWVCRQCGQPRERMTETTGTTVDRPDTDTVGWSDCGHGDYRRGVVLDPFAGTGTTLAVATGHGRDAIGIDLDPRNADLARDRVGMFLEIG